MAKLNYDVSICDSIYKNGVLKLLREFAESGAQIAEFIPDPDYKNAESARSSILPLISRNGLPISIKTKSGRIFLLRKEEE